MSQHVTFVQAACASGVVDAEIRMRPTGFSMQNIANATDCLLT